jgi:hypothetical protein
MKTQVESDHLSSRGLVAEAAGAAARAVSVTGS